MEPFADGPDHLVRGPDHQESPDVAAGQGFPYRLAVVLFHKDGPFHRLYLVLFRFGTGPGQDLGPFDQEAVIDDAVAMMVVGHPDGPETFTRAAGAHKSYYFHVQHLLFKGIRRQSRFLSVMKEVRSASLQ